MPVLRLLAVRDVSGRPRRDAADPELGKPRRSLIERLSPALLLLAPALPAEGQELQQDLERFRFFTECAPESLSVIVGDDDDEPIGLTEDRVRTMAESRLRAARLYAPEIRGSVATLDLTVVVFRNAYAYNAGIAKRRPDPFATGTSPTRIPLNPDIGTHGGGATGANFIVQNLTETVDRLISDYPRVNGEYCQ